MSTIAAQYKADLDHILNKVLELKEGQVGDQLLKAIKQARIRKPAQLFDLTVEEIDNLTIKDDKNKQQPLYVIGDGTLNSFVSWIHHLHSTGELAYPIMWTDLCGE